MRISWNDKVGKEFTYALNRLTGSSDMDNGVGSAIRCISGNGDFLLNQLEAICNDIERELGDLSDKLKSLSFD